MIKIYKNYITILLDSSQSMSCLKQDVINFFNKQLEILAKSSKDFSQETRITVYTFNHKCECLIFDSDVLRPLTISDYYKPSGNTDLIGATLTAIRDLKLIPELYHDASHLIYVISDGEHNFGNNTSNELKTVIESLPENWTIAGFMPNQTAIHYAKKCGFSAQNLTVWDVSSVKDLEENITKSTNKYMVGRSKGIRGTKNLFQLDSSALNTKVVKSVLDVLDPKDYYVFPTGNNPKPIKEFVESWTKKGYTIGSAYYQLTKPEKIQAYKSILLKDKINGKIYKGQEARNLLGLPSYEVKVNPTDHNQYDLFINSTSTNRKLVPNTLLIVMK